MSFKHLFSRALGAAPGRLHMAAHSHHLWPDASFSGQVDCWEDAARLADRKWDRIMGEVWPEAQSHVAAELGAGEPNSIVFASNTHDLLIRLAAACPRNGGPLRILTSDGEFHSARRQFARWEEAGDVSVTRIASEPFGTFLARFADAVAASAHNLIFVSQLMFGSGLIVEDIAAVAALGRSDGLWVAIDGYHSFMALPAPLAESSAGTAFFLGGGYKYAMAGEGCAFMHYRFNAVQRMLASEGLTTPLISSHVAALQQRLIDLLDGSALGRAKLLNPLTGEPHARFLAWRTPEAARWCDSLMREGCVTDVRGDVLRVGLGLYHDSSDIEAFATLARSLS
ncbi:MAG: aminotransferase class V-fold PLP-dependent enzyme [Sphingomonadales bacterium]|nr:aminotransferase class V-fold PLP-dependent enzyme [Sphingomonadales bacterium]